MISVSATSVWAEAHPGGTVGLLELSGVDQPSSSPVLDHQKRAIEARLRFHHLAQDLADGGGRRGIRGQHARPLVEGTPAPVEREHLDARTANIDAQRNERPPARARVASPGAYAGVR